MTRKRAKANVTPVRQRTQFSCMAASMSMALKSLGVECSEDEVAKVMGVRPMRGATWEDALAAAQHYGCRATLTVPATITQIKEWTDAGDPVLIAWNPEGREWSHASVVFDVKGDQTVHVADPNIPDPEETVRVVPRKDFYGKWSEKWPRYLVRRPAMRITREINEEGRQVMSSKQIPIGTTYPSQKSEDGAKVVQFLPEHPKFPGGVYKVSLDGSRFPTLIPAKDLPGEIVWAKKIAWAKKWWANRSRLATEVDRFQSLNTLRQDVDSDTLARHLILKMSDAAVESFFATLADTYHYPLVLGGHRTQMLEDALQYMSVNTLLDELARESSNFDSAVAGVAMDHRITLGADMSTNPNLLSLVDFETILASGPNPRLSTQDYHYLLRQAKFEKGKEMSAEEVAEYLRNGGNEKAADDWLKFHAQNKDNFEKKGKFEKGKSMSAQDVADYLREGGNAEAAEEWLKYHDENKAKFTEDGGKKASVPRRTRLTSKFPNGIPAVHKGYSVHTAAMQKRITADLLMKSFRDLAFDEAVVLAKSLAGARNSRAAEKALRLANEILDGYGVEAIYTADDYDGSPVAEYVNQGDTYNTTIVYDHRDNVFYLTDWGTWREHFERDGGRVR